MASKGWKSTKSVKTKAKSMTNKGKKAMPDDFDQDQSGPEPYGAQVARRLHEDSSILMKDYDEMIGLLDHEGMKAHLQKTLEGMEGNMTKLEDMFSQSYPHLKALGESDDMDTGDMEEGEDFETKDVMDDDLPLDGDIPLDDDLPPDDGSMDDMKDIGGDAVPADSFDEDADIPDPDEVATGMATKSLKSRKKFIKSKKKSLGDDKDKEEKYLIAYRQKGMKGSKSWKTKAFDDDDERDEYAKRLIKAFGEDDVDIMTKDPEIQGKDFDQDEDDITPEMKRLIKNASAFLDEVSEEDVPFDDEKRMKAYYHFKNFEEITGDEEMENKAMPGTPEWEKEEMNEPEHKSKGWHKDMDDDEYEEEVKSLKSRRKDMDENEYAEEMKSLKSRRKGMDDEEDSDAVKMCKNCKSFLKALSQEKAFGDSHREKAAYFKNALDSISDDEDEMKSLKSKRKGIEDDDLEEKGFPDDEDDDDDMKSLKSRGKDMDDDEDDFVMDEDTAKMLKKSIETQGKAMNVLAKELNGLLR